MSGNYNNDDTIWFCINNGFCSFKVKWKEPKQTFCRNKYNVTGLCNKVSCPLANSQYATIMEDEGVCYLYMKTVERAHTPDRLWEKVKIKRNYLEALQQIDTELDGWPEHMINRCKQRLTKMRQMHIRMRKLAMKQGSRMVVIKKKTERREAHRELKAETAAKVDLAIEKELLERLRQGTYGDIYNFPQKQFNTAVSKQAMDEEDELSETEFVEDFGDDDESISDEELELDEDGENADVDMDMGDVEDLGAAGSLFKSRKRGGPRVELEYEEEVATQ